MVFVKLRFPARKTRIEKVFNLVWCRGLKVGKIIIKKKKGEEKVAVKVRMACGIIASRVRLPVERLLAGRGAGEKKERKKKTCQESLNNE